MGMSPNSSFVHQGDRQNTKDPKRTVMMSEFCLLFFWRGVGKWVPYLIPQGRLREYSCYSSLLSEQLNTYQFIIKAITPFYHKNYMCQNQNKLKPSTSRDNGGGSFLTPDYDAQAEALSSFGMLCGTLGYCNCKINIF